MKHIGAFSIDNLWRIFLTLAIWFISSEGYASSMRRLGVEELTNLSSNIIIGGVTNISSYWSFGHSTIHTDVTIELMTVLEGKIADNSIILELLGGTVDGITTAVVGGPSFRVGEEVLLFLGSARSVMYQAERIRFYLVGLSQGKFNLKSTGGKDQRLALSEASQHSLLHDKDGKTMPPGGTGGLLLQELLRQIKQATPES